MPTCFPVHCLVPCLWHKPASLLLPIMTLPCILQAALPAGGGPGGHRCAEHHLPCALHHAECAANCPAGQGHQQVGGCPAEAVGQVAVRSNPSSASWALFALRLTSEGTGGCASSPKISSTLHMLRACLMPQGLCSVYAACSLGTAQNLPRSSHLQLAANPPPSALLGTADRRVN